MKKFRKPERRGQSNPSPRRSPSGGGNHRVHQARSPGGNRPSGRCVVGIHAVQELLNVRSQSVTQIWFRDNFTNHPELTALHEQAISARLKVQMHPLGAMDRIHPLHQGVLAFSQAGPEVDWAKLEATEQSTLVALDEVEDPHNLGAVLRTGWLMGVPAVLTPDHRSATHSPAVSKVAQGAVEHVAIVSDSSLPTQLEALKKHGFWILGLSHEAKQSIFSLEIPQKVVWVLGSEASGIRKSVLSACDDLVSIPQIAPNASYNVSVAAAIVLAETHRQRQAK